MTTYKREAYNPRKLPEMLTEASRELRAFLVHYLYETRGEAATEDDTRYLEEVQAEFERVRTVVERKSEELMKIVQRERTEA